MEPSGCNQWQPDGKRSEPRNRVNRPKPLPWVATSCRRNSMVRMGSTARVCRVLREPGRPTPRISHESRIGLLHRETAGSFQSKKRPVSSLFLDGRYWARTSDPQLVELVLSQLS